MKKLLTVISGVLALNFLVLVGALGYLRANGKIDREKVMAVKDILFPKPVEDAAPTTQPAGPTTRQFVQLEELLAQQSGRPATEQVDFLQQTFDAQMAHLDRRQRELADLQKQVDLAKEQLARDRGVVDTQRKELETREQQAARLASDKGFQDSLALYKSMPGKQVKAIFMTLDQQTVQQYLQAMEPRAATKIVREFKSPEEQAFIQKVMERMRNTQLAQEQSQRPQPQQPQASNRE